MLKMYYLREDEKKETNTKETMFESAGAKLVAREEESTKIKHRIKLMKEEPVRSKPYPLLYAVRQNLIAVV